MPLFFGNGFKQQSVSLLSSDELLYKLARCFYACGLLHLVETELDLPIFKHQSLHFGFEDSLQEQVGVEHFYPLLFVCQFVSHG